MYPVAVPLNAHASIVQVHTYMYVCMDENSTYMHMYMYMYIYTRSKARQRSFSQPYVFHGQKRWKSQKSRF